MPCAPGSGAGHQPAPPSHRWRWEHWVKGSVGARLEIPAEGLQAWGGGSQTEETLQSPRATGKEADFQQGLGCAAAAGGGGSLWGGAFPPALRLGQRASPGQALVTWPGGAARSCRCVYPAGVHTLLPLLCAPRVISGAWWRLDLSGQTGALPRPPDPLCQASRPCQPG